MRRVAGLMGVALASAVIVQACGGDGRGTPLGYTDSTSAGSPGAGSGGGSDFDSGVPSDACSTQGACGDEVHTLEFDAPNVYFIIDRSGSMAEGVSGKVDSRYEVVRKAALGMVVDLGELINPGAAVFPIAETDQDLCTVGGEVFPVTPGDPPGDYYLDVGPTSAAFSSSLKLLPNGGTPVAATLAALTPTLSGLEGRTVALLVTDGGPNCNDELSCSIDQCIPAIEGLCDPGVNCCDEYPGNCIDRADSLTALAGLRDAGVDVYVIGIPGSETYSDVLDDMAEAAGTAQTDASTKYLQVNDLDALGDVLKAIAAEAIGCEFTLDDPPTTENMTNVYFDCEVVPQSMYGGWTWKDPSTIEIHGSQCVALKAGQVKEVQIVTGCPTELPK